MLLSCADRSPNKNQNGRLVKKGVVYEGQQKLLSDFVNAFTRGDAEACAELYTDDTIYMQADLPIEKGKNTVQNGYETSHIDLSLSWLISGGLVNVRF